MLRLKVNDGEVEAGLKSSFGIGLGPVAESGVAVTLEKSTGGRVFRELFDELGDRSESVGGVGRRFWSSDMAIES